MNQRIAGIVAQIHALESDLEVEFARRRMELAFTVKKGVVRFEEHVLKRHRELKTRLSRYILGARPLLILATPVIYSLLIPFVLLDLFISVYQFVCFRLFGLPTVSPQRLYGHRSRSSLISKCHRKDQLCLLLLCEWVNRIHSRDYLID
jgi:hypothetical protein